MSEFSRPVERLHILAQALFDTHNPRESEQGEIKTASIEWDIGPANLTCLLKRQNDARGTSFSLMVFYTDEFYEDEPDDTEEEGLLNYEESWERVNDDYCVEPIESYVLDCTSPGIVRKDVNARSLFLDPQGVHERVSELLHRADISHEALASRERADKEFWKTVGAFALSGAAVEDWLTELHRFPRRKRARAKFIRHIKKKRYGLHAKEIADAMEYFYASDYGQHILGRNGLPKDS